MANEKISEYDSAGQIQPVDLFDVSVISGGPTSKSVTYYQVLGGVKVSKSFDDLSDADLEEDIEIFSLPAGWKLIAILIKHEDAWSGPGINNVEVEAGIAGELDRYADAHDIDQAPGDTIFSDNDLGAIENWSNATSIRANFRTVGANIDQLDAGTVDFYIFAQPRKI